MIEIKLINNAVRNEDISGLEGIIRKIGGPAAFGVTLAVVDFTARRLIDFMERYPKGMPGGLRRSRMHLEFLTLALKYDPEITLEHRLRYLDICESFNEKMDEKGRPKPDPDYARYRGLLFDTSWGLHFKFKGLNLLNTNRDQVQMFKNQILDLAPHEEKILMTKLINIRKQRPDLTIFSCRIG